MKDGGPTTELMDDSTRAQQGNYKVTKQELEDLVQKYQQRKYIEDIEHISNQLKGIDCLMEALDCSLDNGITTQSLEGRTKVFDTHEKEPPQRTPFHELLLASLDDIMLKILMACAIVSMVVDYALHKEGGSPWYVEGLAIWFAIAVVSLVTAISDYQKEGEFLKKQLIEENSKVVQCIRDGKEKTMHRNYIKVGDVIKVRNGMNVPVDGCVLKGNGIMCDESAMTGESDHLPKEEMSKCLQRQADHEAESCEKTPHSVPSPILLSGTQVQTGEGWFLCIVVGDMTVEGQILAGIKSTSETTPLQDKLEVIATDIGKIGMLAAIMIFHALLLRQFIEALIFRRFDLVGGPRMWYEFRIEDNLSGMFGRQVPEACGDDDTACIKANPVSLYKLIDDPDYAQYKDYVTGRCGMNPDLLTKPKTLEEKQEIWSLKNDPATFAQHIADETDGCYGQLLPYFSAWMGFVMTGIAIVVVAVPEGLPLAVMISLAYSVKKMLIDQNFVKRLTSCEIMGGANNICSDKTGTLTKNIMTLTDIWCGEHRDIKNADNDKVGDKGVILGMADNFADNTQFCQSPETLELLKETISCNTTGDCDDSVASEKAMLKFIARTGCDFEQVRKNCIPKDFTRFVFDPVRKRMSTIIEVDPSTTQYGYGKRLHVKGASEIVLETCSHYLDVNGQKQELNDQIRQQLGELIIQYAKKALRTFALGYKDLQENEGGPLHEDRPQGAKCYVCEEGGFTLITLCGIKDIIRDEVPGAVAQCNIAGVRVRMVTGDNKVTAVAIAKECGIIAEGEENDNPQVCMEGPEFNEFVGSLINKNTKEIIKVMGKDPEIEAIGNMENMKIVRSKLKVLARSRPNDKYIMVFGLKELGDIVAVTGDGTNDAPALKKANVGFAMKTGTQVAHTAADIIIQDDNFASIVKACKWGRNVYDNIRRFLQFQLTVNVVALITSFIAATVMKDAPLKPVQLLWVNMIMDSLASLALATEEPVEALLERPPYRRREYIISKKMVKHIGGQAIFQSIILFVFIFGGSHFIPEDQDMIVPYTAIKNGDFVHDGSMETFDLEPLYSQYNDITPSRHLSIVFNMFVWMQIFNMLCARKINDEWNFLEGIHTNGMFIAVILFIVGLQVFVMFSYKIDTKISQAFSVHFLGLTETQWIISLVVGLATFPINAIMKTCPDTWCMTLGNEPMDEVEEAKQEYAELLNIASRYKKFRDNSLQKHISNKQGDSFKGKN